LPFSVLNQKYSSELPRGIIKVKKGLHSLGGWVVVLASLEHSGS
jgi:hypothetical protein